MCIQTNTLVNALLPKELVKNIEDNSLGEEAMLALSRLVLNAGLGAIKNWLKGNLKLLDPNPGDGRCETRGYLLYLQFLNKKLFEDLKSFQKTATKINEEVNSRSCDFYTKCFPPKILKGSSGEFFIKSIEPLAITKKMAFLFQCHLLAVTRAPYETLSNGIINTRTEIGLLVKFSPRISSITTEWKRKIAEYVQREISANSVALLRKRAARLSCFDNNGERELLCKMLSPEMSSVFTPDPEQYEPKTFSFMLFDYKAILYGLREIQGLVCFKSIVPKGQQPFYLLLQPKKAKEEFALVVDEAYTNFSKEISVVFFEGVTSIDRASFAKEVERIGFTELMLALAAIEPPYEPSSTLEDVKDAAAQKEILRYRSLAEKINCDKNAIVPFIVFDHVRCGLMGEVLSNFKGRSS